MRLLLMCVATVVLGLSISAASTADDELAPVLEKAINAPLPAVNYTPSATARDFVDTIDNPYFPLKPGTTMHYSGLKDGQPTTEDFTVTKDRKTILGVNTTVIRDVTYESGKLVEETTDWYAQDKTGNVWYFGEATKALDKGKWMTAGSWQAGVDGARQGVYVNAHPRVGDTYEQEYFQSRPGDSASVLSLAEPITVGYGSYKSAVLTMEWAPDDPGGIDAKYSVAGVGVVKEFAATGATEKLTLDTIAK